MAMCLRLSNIRAPFACILFRARRTRDSRTVDKCRSGECSGVCASALWNRWQELLMLCFWKQLLNSPNH